MPTLTQRERLLAPFRGVTPDRPAWLCDLSYWVAAQRDRGRLEPRYEGPDGYLQLHRDVGAVCYYGSGAATFRAHYDGAEVKVDEANGERTRWWRTPVGELTDTWRYLDGSNCWAHTSYAVTDAHDLRVLADLYRRLRSEPHPTAWQTVSERLGDDGYPICPAPRSPLPALLTDWCGVVGTCLLLADEPALVEDTLSLIEQANEPAIEAMVESDVELFHFCDNLDSSTSTSLFDRFSRDYYRDRLARLHAVGKVAVTHLDGAVRGLLPKLAEVGFDGVESLTPQPVGDVACGEMRQVAGSDTLVLWGGVPGAMFAAPWTDDDLREQTTHWLDVTCDAGRCIVGSADQIPPDGTVDGCRAVAEAVEAWAAQPSSWV